jgi:peroxiredoxin
VTLATRQTLIGPGIAAPDFALEAHTGEQVQLAEYRGAHSLVLHFMRGFT